MPAPSAGPTAPAWSTSAPRTTTDPAGEPPSTATARSSAASTRPSSATAARPSGSTGALTVLAPDGVGEILSLSHGGNFAGATGGFDTGANLWTNNGGVWTETVIGLLDGTDPFDHDAGTLGVSDDGSIAVGFNRSGFGPFADYDGFIWNEEGMVDVEIWLADNGIDVGNLDIRQLVDISGDGSVMAGWGYHDGFQISSFRITIVPAPASAALLGLSALAAVRRRR